jgi:hypothetical protein
MRRRWLMWIVAVVLVDAATYVALCRPELNMARTDPSGYAYLAKVRASAGGIWSLSPEARCGVHLAAATLVVSAIFWLATYVAHRREVLRERAEGVRPVE